MPIRSERDHLEALQRVRSLILLEDQASMDELEILQILIEKWENDHFPVELPTPADAIRFRMQHLGLKPRDLIPYLGSKSRVSELLGGQRQLTIDQVRALNQHLGIPATSLIGGSRHQSTGQLSSTTRAAGDRLRSLGILNDRESVGAFIGRVTVDQPAVAMLRKTRTDRTNAKTDLSALQAWCGAVMLKAEAAHMGQPAFEKRGLDVAKEIARLSRKPNGPLLVGKALSSIGIILVVLDHLPGTFLDGAAIFRGDNMPVIALTLRHDRIDNFWFTLMHEFAHVSCHLGGGVSAIFDDLEVKSSETIEAEADAFAREALIPQELWQEFSDRQFTAETVDVLARQAGVHPAVVAGRWRWEHGDYRRFSKLVGRGEVRKLFG